MIKLYYMVKFEKKIVPTLKTFFFHVFFFLYDIEISDCDIYIFFHVAFNVPSRTAVRD